MRELLSDRAAPGYAGDVDLRIAEFRNKTGGEPRERRGAIRQERLWRAAHAGHVENDRGRTREGLEKGPRQFPVGPDPIEQQQWRLLAAAMLDRDLKRLPADRHLQ